MTKEEIREEVENFLRDTDSSMEPANIKQKVAYLLGMEIEWYNTNRKSWELDDGCEFSRSLTYRIKPKETYRPFTYDDVKNMEWDKWIIGEKDNNKIILAGITKEGFITEDTKYFRYYEALRYWTINGEKCGVKI